MRIVWMLVFAAMIAYVAWWLIGSIRKRIAFEIEMALGVGSLWAAIFVPTLFDLPDLLPWPVVLVLNALSVTCFALAARAEDQFNVAKLGESYRIYMKQVPALNLLSGIWAKLQTRREP